MAIKLNHIHQPSLAQLADNYHQFLSRLAGPTVLHVDGEDPDRTRVVVTLLHGNEPSGLSAIHRFLKEAQVPATQLVIIIASVIAAKTPPFYSHRMLAGQRDLNRCFNGPVDDLQGQLAMAISEQIRQCQPEAIIDIHNTSGSGPAFCVSAVHSRAHAQLTSHFAKRTIYTDIRLGSIMEQDFGCPIITVEAGGALDVEADENAFCGLYSFLTSPNPYVMQQAIEPLLHPRRLELLHTASISYASHPTKHSSLIMFTDIEKFNFGVTPAHQTLGWLTEPLKSVLRLDADNQKLGDYFFAEQGMLKTVRPLKLFMVTTRSDIAKSDCLFYFVEAEQTVPLSTAEDESG